MFSTGVTGGFVCTHALIGDFGDETIPHSHNYLLEWSISVTGLDENGFGINIAHMEQVRDNVFAGLVGLNLNDEDFFSKTQSSIENVSVYLARQLMGGLAEIGFPTKTFHSCEVKIWENDHAWASYSTQSLSDVGVN